MQIIIRIAIIALAILLIRLLKRWIRRIIFIAILLCLAFLIYGIFNPSGAAKLRYNIRTFPQRITSRTSNQKFLDYEKYKLGTIKIGDSSEIDINFDEEETTQNKEGDSEESLNTDEDIKKIKSNNSSTDKIYNNEGKIIHKFQNYSQTTFPRFEINTTTTKSENNDIDPTRITTGSKSDLLKIINSYIEKNLDDDTNIVVTVEYNEDSEDFQKIILETIANNSESNAAKEYYLKEQDTENIIKNQESKSIKQTSTLSQKEIKEAKEISSLLF